MALWVMWSSVGCFCLIAEALHPGLFIFLPFSVSAFLTAGIALYWQLLWVQIAVFFISVACLFFVFQKWSMVRKDQEATNVYALIGRTGYVVAPITNYQKGYVYVNGQYWLADAPQALFVGTSVRVTDVRGCHLEVVPEA